MTNWWHINPLFGSILVVIAIMLWVVIFLWLYCQNGYLEIPKTIRSPYYHQCISCFSYRIWRLVRKTIIN